MSCIVFRSLSLKDKTKRRNSTLREKFQQVLLKKTQQHTTDFPEISSLHMELVWFGLVFLFAVGKLKKCPEPVYVCI